MVEPAQEPTLQERLRDYAVNGYRSWPGISDLFREAAAALDDKDRSITHWHEKYRVADRHAHRLQRENDELQSEVYTKAEIVEALQKFQPSRQNSELWNYYVSILRGFGGEPIPEPKPKNLWRHG